MRLTQKPFARLGNGFTLIELLIVVAIIAILAAIAVPNFLEAQVRSKTSRVLSDLRTLRTAVEAYAVDYNKPPIMTWGILSTRSNLAPSNGLCSPGFFNTTYWDAVSPDGEQLFGTLPKGVTTPIAYITSQPLDPFAANTSASDDAKLYTYQAPGSQQFIFTCVGNVPVPGMPGYVYIAGSNLEIRNMENYFGKYVLWSIGPAGPDRITSANFWLQYDPTNGTVSEGHIFVSQKYQQPTYTPPF